MGGGRADTQFLASAHGARYLSVARIAAGTRPLIRLLPVSLLSRYHLSFIRRHGNSDGKNESPVFGGQRVMARVLPSETRPPLVQRCPHIVLGSAHSRAHPLRFKCAAPLHGDR